MKIPAEEVILLYETFEQLIESTLSNLKAVYVKLENAAGVVLKITLEGVSAVLGEDTKDKLFRAGIPVTIKHEDEASSIRFRLTKGV